MTTHREIAARMIRDGEGLVLVVYDDATGRPLKQGDTIRGHPTIGYGRHLADKGISEDEAQAMLAADLADAEMIAMGFVGGPVWRALGDVRRGVLMDMAHNLGATRLYQFVKLRGALERTDYVRAAAEIENSRYFQQVGRRGVRNRDAMRSGQWDGAPAAEPERLVPRPAPTPEPAPAPPAVEHPGKWPEASRRWVMRRKRHNAPGHEYWTGLHVGPQDRCTPVVSLDPAKAERWIDEAAALAAVRAYDDRMFGQGYEAHWLDAPA